MFYLLNIFSSDRNSYAPILYKSLTFLLIEFHLDTQLREQLMHHFSNLFIQIQTMPITILCEPLLKQIEISGPQYDFNTFDFDFFHIVIIHKRTDISIAIPILDVMFYNVC